MFNVPVSFFFDFGHVSETLRPCIMAEFANAGAKHLVLTCTFIKDIINQSGLEDTLLKEMADNGLSFCDAHAPFGAALDLNCPWESKRRIMLERLRLALEICSYMKVDTIALHVGNNHFEGASHIPDDLHINRMKEALSQILPTAEKLGITLCIENIWLSVNSPDVLNDIKRDFPTPYLGFCYDSGHANIMDNGRLQTSGVAWKAWNASGKDTPIWEDKALEKMLPHIVNCHLHDNNGIGDEHTNPGKGNINWSHTIKLLKSAPRLKVIQSEVSPVKSGIFIKEMVDKFNELGDL